MNSLIIVNPNAGKKKFASEVVSVASIFQKHGYSTDISVTETTEDVEKVFLEKGDNADIIICGGGDGTLNLTVNSMMRAGLSIPIGYIPAGTTNDIAGSLGLPKKIPDASEIIASGDLHDMDAGLFNGSKYFVYVASFGAFTQTSYTTTQSLKNTFGHLAYIIEGMKELPVLKSYYVKAETDSDTFEDKYIFGAVANSSSIGGVIHLDKNNVEYDDGLFEMLLVKAPSNIIELSVIVVSLMSGNYDDNLIKFVKTSKVKFTSEDSIPWSLDGEYAEGGTEITIENIKHAYTIKY